MQRKEIMIHTVNGYHTDNKPEFRFALIVTNGSVQVINLKPTLG